MALPHRKHDDRTDLVGEHPRGDLFQVVLIVAFLVIWAADSFFLHMTDFLREDVPVLLRIMAMAMIMVPAYLCVRLAHKTIFGTIRKEPELLSAGIFSIVRHPLYLGSILFILALVAATLSLASLLIWMVIVVFYVYISNYEEKMLLRHFGDAYSTYRKKVPMLFPRFRRN